MENIVLGDSIVFGRLVFRISKRIPDISTCSRRIILYRNVVCIKSEFPKFIFRFRFVKTPRQNVKMKLGKGEKTR